MHRAVLIVALAMSTLVGPQAQIDATAVTVELASLDRQWQEAVVRGDAEFIEKRTSDGFTFTHGGGRPGTKAEWLRNTKQVPKRFLKRIPSNQSVEVHGDIALVFGRLDVRVPGASDSGPACYALEYAHLYARQNGQWMFLSHRTTRVLEERHPCAPK